MRLAAIVLACLALNGCASAPADFEATGANVTEFKSQQPPRQVLNCMARNSLHAGNGLIPVIVDAPSGAAEMAMIGQQGALVLFAVASPMASGSQVRLRNHFLGPLRKGAEETLLKGC